LNLARRQLNREQKRQIIANQLQETPDRSARWLAKMLGVNHRTVISVRDELQSGGEILHLDKIVGEDGRCYPSSTSASGPLLGSAGSSAACVNHERYTPSWLVAAARQVLGDIDLDPASSKQANKVVKANAFFTKQTDGLKRCWRGRIFLNPPFDNWPAWVAKLDREIEARRVKQVILIGPANLSAYRCLLKRGGLLLVPNERPKYYDPGGDKLVDPPFGSLICYMGRRRDSFLAAFSAHGLILRAIS
jgi:ParB family chromosome partitioning protein